MGALGLLFAMPALADAPVFKHVPSNITTEASSPAGAVVHYNVVAHDDNGPPDVVCTPPSNSTFPFGTTSVSCTATDTVDGSTATAGFNVTVQDTTPPALSLPGSFSVQATSSSGATVTYAASGSDAVDGSITPSCSPASGTVFGFGSTTVNCTATDSHGNTANGSFAVTVADTTAPVVTVPSSPVTATTTTTGPVPVSFSTSATDNIDGSVPVTCNHASGSTFPAGSTLVTCTATDAHGNTGSAGFTVTITVIDTTAPVVTVPSSPVTATTTTPSGAQVSFSASATDNIDGSLPASCSPSSGSSFPIGTTGVTCSATDAHGNTGSAGFNVVVTLVDTTAPVVTVPASSTVEATSAGGTSVSWTGVSATDALDGSVAATCSPASGSSFPFGTTTVTCSATDAHGNTGTASFTVTVQDTTAPAFSNVPSNTKLEANSSGGSIFNYTPPTATDLGAPVPVTCSPASGARFPMGTTQVTCNATDGTNTSSVSFSVSIADTTPPVLTTPHGITISSKGASSVPASDQFITAWLAAAAANDLVDGPVPVSNDAPTIFTTGVTLVTFTAADRSGNKVTRSEAVTVTAAPAPTPVISDTAPPDNVRGLKLIPSSGTLTLVWQAPLAADFDHVIVLRSDADDTSTEQTVYRGSALTYQDKGLTNGKTYRYLVRSVDASGNRSAGVAILGAPAAPQLLKPAAGAKLKAPKKVVFAWAAFSGATYYNVQIFRNGKKVLSIWPLINQMTLNRKWTFAKKAYTLSAGVYVWYVWPGIGARSLNQYGPMLGQSTFTVV